MINYPLIVAEMSRLQWAITPEAMNGLKTAVESGLKAEDREAFHVCSEEDYQIIASELGTRIEGSSMSRIRGNVGSLLIAGPIVPRAGAFAKASGLVSIDSLTAEFRALEADPRIERIVMVFDSPGGAVTGVAEFASVVAGCDKHVTAYIQGSAASAAYWIASAADTIVSSPTGLSGSIGVIMTVNTSKDSDEIEIISSQSPDKRMDATTDAGKAKISKIVDGLADVFIGTVAENRGAAVDKVLSDFGKGAVLVASEALAAGMIDKVDTLVNTIKAADNSGANVTISADAEIQKENETMPTLQEMLAKHPELKGEIEAIEAAARKAGATAEKEKVDSRVKGATPYLQSADYPPVIRKMAADVLSGKEQLTTLVGVVAVFDALKTQEEIVAAVADSDEQPEVGASPVHEASADGVLRTVQDIDAEIRALRGEAE